MAWTFDRSKNFKRGYKKANNILQRRIDQALIMLYEAENPEELGVKKHGQWINHHAFEFGRACRLLFEVDRGKRTINLDRVCSHKEYGP